MFIDESRTASKYTNGASVGRGNPTEILIHHWGVDGQTHDGVVSFFERESTGTSAHFVVSEGRIHCLVSTADVAWHAGDWAVNLRSVGIECRPEATDGDYKAVAWLIGWLREQFGNIPLAPHRKYAQTACPGRYDLARLVREASGTISTQTSNITPIQEDTLSAAEVQAINTFTQQLIHEERATIVAEIRAAADRVGDRVGKEVYSGKVFAQASDNFTGDRILVEARANVAALLEALKQATAGTGAVLDLEKIQAAAQSGAEKALAEGLVKVQISIEKPEVAA